MTGKLKIAYAHVEPVEIEVQADQGLELETLEHYQQIAEQIRKEESVLINLLSSAS